MPNTNSLLRTNCGIPRNGMPQLAGFPADGSLASALPRTEMGGVDLGAQFWRFLAVKGYLLTHEWRRASDLRATQSELNYGKICTLTKLIEQRELPATCIYIAGERHVVDGHHRWAAEVVWAYRHGMLRTHKVLTSKVDLSVRETIREAFEFLEIWGPLT